MPKKGLDGKKQMLYITIIRNQVLLFVRKLLFLQKTAKLARINLARDCL